MGVTVKLWSLLAHQPVSVCDFFFSPSPFENQVLTISCCHVPFQRLGLPADGPGVILDVFRLCSWCLCQL